MVITRGQFHTLLCSGLTRRLAVHEQHLIGVCARLSQHTLELMVRKGFQMGFLQVLEEIFASALGTPNLPLLYFLTLFESRHCAFSFYPAIILMISWCPVPSREAICGTCMLYVAVEVCQMHIERLGSSVVIRSVLGAQ